MNGAFLSPFATFDSITLNDPIKCYEIHNRWKRISKGCCTTNSKEKKEKNAKETAKVFDHPRGLSNEPCLGAIRNVQAVVEQSLETILEKINSFAITLARYRASYIFPQQSRRINGGTKMFSLLTRNRSRREKSRVLSLGRADGSSRI